MERHRISGSCGTGLARDLGDSIHQIGNGASATCYGMWMWNDNLPEVPTQESSSTGGFTPSSVPSML
ncbi:hypothetical protein VTK56DRAFT_7431 [Thermocarpiscus australiensis]